MKILFIDIETAPNLVHVWGLWQQNVGINQIIDSGYTMCFSAKWLGEPEVIFDSVHQSGHKKMIKHAHKLLDQADAVVHWNGSKFDIPTLNKEFIIHGLRPPAPYKQMDLLKTSRQQFKFPSNKLNYVAKALGLGQKIDGITHDLWIKCMAKDEEAWTKMRIYNIQDTLLLEKVYKRMLPWIKGHANYSLYKDDLVCPNCGSHKLQKRGFSYTSSAKYQRLQCQDCGAWSKTGGTLAAKPDNKVTSL